MKLFLVFGLVCLSICAISAESEPIQEEQPAEETPLEDAKCTWWTAGSCIKQCAVQKAVPNCCTFTNGITCQCHQIAFAGKIPKGPTEFLTLSMTQFACAFQNVKNGFSAMIPGRSAPAAEDEEEQTAEQ